jgi:GT2 family glycosyltransferase
MSDAAPSSLTLSVSIVVYFSDPAWLTTTLETLVAALAHARHAGAMRRAKICLVDNQAANAVSPYSAQLDAACKELGWIEMITVAGQGNIGYGRANNLAIARCTDADFHLVLNPDVKLEPDAITNALRYLQQHEACAMVTPVATAADGQPLYLAKRFPDFFTLALRGFAPAWIRRRFRARLDAYERRETPFDAGLTDVKIASGCFMLMRRPALAQAQGFDPAFFLYFEDFDLSYRLAKQASIARVADVRIVHAGGRAAAKGWRHVWLFVQSASRFRRKHG